MKVGNKNKTMEKIRGGWRKAEFSAFLQDVHAIQSALGRSAIPDKLGHRQWDGSGCCLMQVNAGLNIRKLSQWNSVSFCYQETTGPTRAGKASK